MCITTSPIIELEPTAFQRQKSFYGKARYFSTCNYIVLKSYDTIVCSYEKSSGRFHRHWSGYSSTTLRHVDAFISMRHGRNLAMSKHKWENLPVEPIPDEILNCFCY